MRMTTPRTRRSIINHQSSIINPSPVIQNTSGRRLPPGVRSLTASALRRCLRFERRQISLPPELTLRFVSDREIRSLNRRFHRRDRTTDVLAFATGDIAVSVDTARRQAPALGHGWGRELAHLAVHGLLHLLGWRDRSARQRAAMDRATEAVLGSARC